MSDDNIISSTSKTNEKDPSFSKTSSGGDFSVVDESEAFGLKASSSSPVISCAAKYEITVTAAATEEPSSSSGLLLPETTTQSIKTKSKTTQCTTLATYHINEQMEGLLKLVESQGDKEEDRHRSKNSNTLEESLSSDDVESYAVILSNDVISLHSGSSISPVSTPRGFEEDKDFPSTSATKKMTAQDVKDSVPPIILKEAPVMEKSISDTAAPSSSSKRPRLDCWSKLCNLLRAAAKDGQLWISCPSDEVS